MSDNDLSPWAPLVSPDYIQQQLGVLESQKEVLAETVKWRGRNEVIAAILSAGTVFANIHGIPIPPVTPGMVDWIFEKVKSWFT
jgi:hypothetical protein